MKFIIIKVYVGRKNPRPSGTIADYLVKIPDDRDPFPITS